MGNSAGKLLASVSSVGPLGPARKSELIRIVLDVVQKELVPLAESSVENGDVFSSAAILRKNDLSVVVKERDTAKTKDPLATAEANVIQSFFALAQSKRPAPRDCIFLCMHEPSALALLQIAQCGFDNFVFLYKRETSKEFGIEEPVASVKEIFGTETESYNAENALWTAVSFGELIDKSDKKAKHQETLEAIGARYRKVTNTETEETSTAKAPEAEAPVTPEKSTVAA